MAAIRLRVETPQMARDGFSPPLSPQYAFGRPARAK
jgi:hypothetical protein